MSDSNSEQNCELTATDRIFNFWLFSLKTWKWFFYFGILSHTALYFYNGSVTSDDIAMFIFYSIVGLVAFTFLLFIIFMVVSFNEDTKPGVYRPHVNDDDDDEEDYDDDDDHDYVPQKGYARTDNQEPVRNRTRVVSEPKDYETYALQENTAGSHWSTIAQGPENWMIDKMEQKRSTNTRSRFRVVRLVNGKNVGTSYS